MGQIRNGKRRARTVRVGVTTLMQDVRRASSYYDRHDPSLSRSQQRQTNSLSRARPAVLDICAASSNIFGADDRDR